MGEGGLESDVDQLRLLLLLVRLLVTDQREIKTEMSKVFFDVRSRNKFLLLFLTLQVTNKKSWQVVAQRVADSREIFFPVARVLDF